MQISIQTVSLISISLTDQKYPLFEIPEAYNKYELIIKLANM